MRTPFLCIQSGDHIENCRFDCESMISKLLKIVLLTAGVIGNTLADSRIHEQYLVKAFPNEPVDYEGRMHAGHLNQTDQLDGDLFFWMFESVKPEYEHRSVSISSECF